VGARRGSRGRGLAATFGCAAALASPAASTGALPVGPTLTSAPIVIGVASAGKRLTGLSGVWTGTGAILYRFQWFRCNAAGANCLPIGGATSPTYTLVAKDVGKTVGLTVYASDSTGTAAAYASLVGPIATAAPPLVSTVQPVVRGAPVVGRTISVTSGVWSPVVATISYAWERCDPQGRACARIPDAGGRSYRVRPEDLGHGLVALVQAANSTTLQNTFSTSTPAVVAKTVDGPLSLTLPEITGTAASGSQLIAATGRWQGVGTVSFAFQWYLCNDLGSDCSSLHGATGATIQPGPADAGKTIGLTLRATDLTGTAIAYASLVGPVSGPEAPLTATSPPTITGKPSPGSSLTVEPGVWSSPPSGYTYRWLRCGLDGRDCTPIKHATAASYTPAPTDSGHTLIALVDATAGESTQLAFSIASAPIG